MRNDLRRDRNFYASAFFSASYDAALRERFGNAALAIVATVVGFLSSNPRRFYRRGAARAAISG